MIKSVFARKLSKVSYNFCKLGTLFTKEDFKIHDIESESYTFNITVNKVSNDLPTDNVYKLYVLKLKDSGYE